MDTVRLSRMKTVLHQLYVGDLVNVQFYRVVVELLKMKTVLDLGDVSVMALAQPLMGSV